MEISFAASPTCLAGLRRAIRGSLAEAPAAIPDEVVDDVVLAVSEAATNAVLYGSGDAQPVTVTVRVRGGWIEATIRDRGRPTAPPTALVTGLRGRGLWLIGQLVDELRIGKARPGTLVTLRRCIGDPAGGELPDGPAASNGLRSPPRR
ncbi:MAG TPA: ATP-binding protein [Actinomycetota bacterium]|jgi:anti-sigma regulatory factor (Ser/Thr protein kinase)|nr:ATP-binding protein [Actinomycetota bacterium]